MGQKLRRRPGRPKGAKDGAVSDLSLEVDIAVALGETTHGAISRFAKEDAKSDLQQLTLKDRYRKSHQRRTQEGAKSGNTINQQAAPDIDVEGVGEVEHPSGFVGMSQVISHPGYPDVPTRNPCNCSAADYVHWHCDNIDCNAALPAPLVRWSNRAENGSEVTDTIIACDDSCCDSALESRGSEPVE